MNEKELRANLSSLLLGEMRFFESIGSTNDEAQAWAADGALDLSLVIADEQTAGRGRSGRKWYTPREAALAFSLILRPSDTEKRFPARITGLGALALVEACQDLGLHAQIKWPNDALIANRKVAGILVESVWAGDTLEASILGMGVNVLATAMPPQDQVLFPATSLESVSKQKINRFELLHQILLRIIAWRSKLGTGEFLKAWENSLAYQGVQVEVWSGNETPTIGEIAGLETDGSLRLRLPSGKLSSVRFGEIHLRPAV